MEKASVGKILRGRREELALTQRQVAIEVGVTESAVSRWESGEIDNMRRDKLANIAKALEIFPLLIMGVENAIPARVPPNPEELSLIDGYRTLTSEDKSFVLNMIKRLRGTESSKTNKSTFNSQNGSNFGVVDGNFSSNNARTVQSSA